MLKLDEVRRRAREERRELEEMLNDDESEGSLKDFICDDSDESLSVTGSSSRPSSVSSDASVIILDPPMTKASTRANMKTEPQVVPAEQCNGQPSPPVTWYSDVLDESCSWDQSLSGKMTFLLELLQEVERVKEKLLVFSQSLLILDYIEEVIKRPENGNLAEGIEYLRIDGSTKADNRACFMKRFNKRSNERSATPPL